MFTLSRMRRKGEFHSGVVVGTRWAGLKMLISSDFHAQRSTEVMQNALGGKKKNKKHPACGRSAGGNALLVRESSEMNDQALVIQITTFYNHCEQKR